MEEREGPEQVSAGPCCLSTRLRLEDATRNDGRARLSGFLVAQRRKQNRVSDEIKKRLAQATIRRLRNRLAGEVASKKERRTLGKNNRD